MHRCYAVSRVQNFVCNIQTHQQLRRDTNMQVSLSCGPSWDTRPSPFALVTNSTCQGDSFNIAKYLTLHFHYSFWVCPFFYQSVKLSASSTESAHCSKDTNANQLLREQSAEFYSCEICKNLFSRGNILSGHTRVSNRESTSYCEMCVKLLSDNRNEVQRPRGHERPLSCNICNKGFNCPSNLDKHILVHTRELPTSCEMCKKSFSQRCNLITHLRVHTGERRFSCEMRKKTFARRFHVKCHVRLHRGERPLSCELCKKRLSSL
jgi:hypothetical protein